MGHVKINSAKQNIIEVTLSNENSRKAVNMVIFLLGLFSLILPFSILFINELEIGFGYLITLFIFIGSSLFFFRIYLWNTYGKEIYQIEKNKISYFYDYRLFKDNRKKISFKRLEIAYYKLDDLNNLCSISVEDKNINLACYICLVADAEIIKSNIPVTFKHLKQLSDMFLQHQ